MTNQPKKATTRRKSTASKNEDPPVYLLSMEVEDLLCFKERQTLNLSNKDGHPAQWTVILGNNGVGKTTLLRCLAGMEMRPESYEHSIAIDGVEKFKQVEIDFEPMLWQSYNFEEIWEEIGIAIHESYRGATIPAINVSYASNITLNSFKIVKNLEFQKDYVSVIVDSECEKSRGEFKGAICYGYGATRKMGGTSLSDSNNSDNSASLFSDDALLINAEEWLLKTDYAVKSSSSGKRKTHLKKRLKQIVEILKQILPDIQDIRIEIDEYQDIPTAKFLTPFGWVRLSSLGLGYRTTISWMVDLAVRLFERYPDSEDPLAEPAIVLVDEIDLHMHPKWQRDIMQFLTDRFPNTQFIVTAHSPLVVQAAQDANIVLLRREGDQVKIINNPEIIDNWRVDQVLTSVFEMPSARPAKIEPLLQRRKELLTKAKLTASDRAELKELEAQIGTLPTAETSEDIKAMDIIRRAAKLLDKPVTEAVE
ncbi:AAA family ATPase [Pseudanabaena yagii]|uniref:AAA family ATPase n=1 Tax=Pseudanabaena yagii GIHE-NHR1 TaxID=2722753 RepID=A0ABX1LWU6_9CYAN|nr:AAA family ATPase [Pseudanabaena yagii]NMF59244.1 AAA family ATPase [Pseudanabaena yagii GIHE-NHR1]